MPAVPSHLRLDQEAPSVRRPRTATPGGARVPYPRPSCSSGPFSFPCLLSWTCHFPQLFPFGLSLLWSLKTRLYLDPVSLQPLPVPFRCQLSTLRPHLSSGSPPHPFSPAPCLRRPGDAPRRDDSCPHRHGCLSVPGPLRGAVSAILLFLRALAPDLLLIPCAVPGCLTAACAPAVLSFSPRLDPLQSSTACPSSASPGLSPTGSPWPSPPSPALFPSRPGLSPVTPPHLTRTEIRKSSQAPRSLTPWAATTS